jgi:tungstate transport system substrate-binding protein
LSSAEAFAYGAAGSADVLVTHEPESLEDFIEAHPGASTAVVFVSDFLVAVPPGTAIPETSVVDVFADVASRSTTFVSRDDGSGTNARERAIWRVAGVDPTGSEWYVETGSGMISTLLIASERRAVTLAERGAFLAASEEVALEELRLESVEMLDNPYDLTLVSDAAAASRLAAWLLGDAGRAAIRDANRDMFGSQVYRLP